MNDFGEMDIQRIKEDLERFKRIAEWHRQISRRLQNQYSPFIIKKETKKKKINWKNGL